MTILKKLPIIVSLKEEVNLSRISIIFKRKIMRIEESAWEEKKARPETVRKGREFRRNNLTRLSLLNLPLLKRYQININAMPILKKGVRYFLRCLIVSKGGTKIMDN
jgi:hypothetical protein